ncbi:MAG: DUF2142 domain-containing protein [Anaerolineae bacterium]|nr:DUF2142 domain-containing protein [Anaerolineae bacterium]
MKQLFRPLPLILLAFVVLGIIYSVVTPIFEASDELWHYPVIDYMIRQDLALPEQDPDNPALWQQEGSQPPLYYWISAALVRWVDHGDMAERRTINPHGKAGIALATDNNAVILHDWDAESFPWKNTALAVHLVRFFGILLGVGTVWLSYHIARLTLPNRPAIPITVALLVAFNPMFLFISGSVNNDNLINLIAAAILVLLLLIWRDGFNGRRIGILAVLLALGSITKLSGLTFYPLAGLVLLGVTIRDRRPPRDLILAGTAILAVWIVLAGWWYWRNFDLYDDPTGLNVMVEIAGPRDDLPGLSAAWDELKGFRSAFWGWFGALNVIGPDWLFTYGDALTVIGVVGLVVYLVRGFTSPPNPLSIQNGEGEYWFGRNSVIPVLILLIQILVVSGGVINWTRRTYASQGRLLFTVLGPLMTLAALGVYTLLPRGKRFLPLIAAPLMVAAVAIPFTIIAPRYDPPPTVANLPDGAIPVEAQFGPVTLLGLEVTDDAVRPGDSLAVTVYWLPREHTAAPLSFFIQVFGREDENGELQQIGKLDSYPGRGLLATTSWDPDRIYQDTYQIEINAETQTPVRPILKIGWWDYATRQEIAPVTLDGTPRDPVLIEAGRVIGNDQHLDGGQDAAAIFGGVLRLNRSRITPESAAPGDTIRIELEWESLTRVYEDFTVLVHLVDPASPGSAPPITQGDAPPLRGRWPTSAWAPRAPFTDAYTITLPDDLPPGEYRIAVGFYRPADFTRLPVETALGTLPGAVLLPGTITVE